jgi:heme exporter protein D
MIELGKHADFVVSAWGGVALVTLIVIGWVWLQSRRAKARIAALEAQGIRRRSEGPAA